MTGHKTKIPDSSRMVFNGVDCESGDYLTPPLTAEEVLSLARAERDGSSSEQQALVTALYRKTSEPHLGFDAELGDPSDARWGVIFAEGENDQVRQEMAALIEHRAGQLGFQPPVFEYHPKMNYTEFLQEHGVAPGFGQVAKVPYYLTIVGDPNQIPFRFQYELGSEYAVGRVDFENAEGYRAYVQQLIDYETSVAVPTRKQAVFWATANPDDPATALSSSLLAQPLYDGIEASWGFDKQIFLAGDAKKSNLQETCNQALAPGFLFTASHGLGFRKPNSRQPAMQGALVTQEWIPGTPTTPAELFGGGDLAAAGNVRGLVHFAFACFGAGTPKQDDFAHGKSSVAPILAENPFTANLPRQELLRGAIAFVGHIERAWSCSFIGTANTPMLTGFQRAIKRILTGYPVGYALRDQHDHAIQLSHSLLEDMNEMDFGKEIPALAIAEKWKARNDARSYAVIGDPAARLRVKNMR